MIDYPRPICYTEFCYFLEVDMKRSILCFILIFLLIFLCSCYPEQTTELKIIEDKSCFNDFVIESETVTFYCTVFLQNDTAEPKMVELHGDFTEDYESGLIREALLQAYEPQSGDTIFLLSPGENHLRIAFSCLHARETNQKQNRLLPKITITEVQNG